MPGLLHLIQCLLRASKMLQMQNTCDQEDTRFSTFLITRGIQTVILSYNCIIGSVQNDEQQ